MNQIYTKRVIVFEIDKNSDEARCLHKLLNLSLLQMKKIEFSDEEYQVSCNIQAMYSEALS